MNFLHDSKPPNTGWPSRTNIKSVCCSLLHLLTVLLCLNNNWNYVWGCCTTSLLLFQRLRNFVAAFGSWYGKTFELSTDCWKYPEITLSDQPDRLTRLIYGSTREKFIRFNQKSFIIDIIEPWLRTCVICNSIPLLPPLSALKSKGKTPWDRGCVICAQKHWNRDTTNQRPDMDVYRVTSF